MSFFHKHQLKVVTVIYWVMLIYMVAALGWWFIALNKQNNAMATYKMAELKRDDNAFEQNVSVIEEERKRKTAQYIGEGVTFLLLMIIGAAFVFRSVRRQLVISQQQQNFIMAVTHELKTPIAVTQLNLETLQKRKLEEATKERLITNTIIEANRLNQMCNNILLAAQIDAEHYKQDWDEVNFSSLVSASVKDFSIRYPGRNIELITEGDLFINGELLRLQMLVNNLIENALKYSPKESSVVVELKNADEGKITLLVKDEGQGVADNEKKKIFEKFYRSGNENTRKAKGTGLGLYLCKRIVQKHHGKISVSNNHPKGTIFTVTI